MATIKIILGFFCLIALCSGWRTERSTLNCSYSILNPFSSSQSAAFCNSDSRRNLIQLNDDHQTAYQQIVAAAQKEVGTVEGRISNSGAKVSKYLRYVGIRTPAPWCAAWVSYVFKQAGLKAPQTAWSPALFPTSRQVKEPRAGIVLGIYYAALKRVGHCGIVERVSKDWVFSIEGNTGNTNERDGNGVWRKRRHKRSIHCYADWVKGVVK